MITFLNVLVAEVLFSKCSAHWFIFVSLVVTQNWLFVNHLCSFQGLFLVSFICPGLQYSPDFIIIFSLLHRLPVCSCISISLLPLSVSVSFICIVFYFQSLLTVFLCTKILW